MLLPQMSATLLWLPISVIAFEQTMKRVCSASGSSVAFSDANAGGCKLRR